MSRFVRPSKYRRVSNPPAWMHLAHVYGAPAKKEASYDNVKVSANAWDTNLVTANSKYIAVNWQASGGGAFAVIPQSRVGKLPDVFPLCRGHTAPVLDTSWSPFDDDLVASGSEDGSALLWKIDEHIFDQLDEKEGPPGAQKPKTEAQDLAPTGKLGGGGRKIGHVLFHPTAANVLATAGGDHVIRLWDIEKSTSPVSLSGFTDTIQSLSFNWTGSLLAATCRDRKFRLFDTRTSGGHVQVSEGHGGIKGARVAWCGNLDRIVTTGFSKMSDRQLFLWDSGNISKPLKSVTLDTSSGVTMPFWSDNNIVFLAGKGDGNIRYYELENDDLHYLSEYKSSDPQRGMGFVPRRAVNFNENEIARAYKCTGNLIEPISFIVPRRAETFQSDIFPPAPSSVPALTADEFFAGKTATPNLFHFDTGSSVASKPTEAPKLAPINATAGAPSTSQGNSPHSASPLPAPTPTASAPAPAPAAAAAPAASPAQPAVATPTPASAVSAVSALPPQESGSTLAALKVSSDGEAANGSSVGSSASLQREVDDLKAQLAERDAIIRKLELENEKLKVNQRKVAELLTS